MRKIFIFREVLLDAMTLLA